MTTDQEAAFFLGIRSNDSELVRVLVAADPVLLTTSSPMGVSPVLFATYYQKPEMARLLVELGAPLDFFEAAAVGEIKQVKQALADDSKLLEAYSSDGFTALGLASSFGHTKLAEMLLEAGANVHVVSQNAMQVQPLHSAVAGNHTEIVHLLLKAGADFHAPQTGGMTPLMSAAQNGNAELVTYFLEHGADASLKSEDGQTASDLACECAYLDIARQLDEAAGAEQ